MSLYGHVPQPGVSAARKTAARRQWKSPPSAARSARDRCRGRPRCPRRGRERGPRGGSEAARGQEFALFVGPRLPYTWRLVGTGSGGAVLVRMKPPRGAFCSGRGPRGPATAASGPMAHFFGPFFGAEWFWTPARGPDPGAGWDDARGADEAPGAGGRGAGLRAVQPEFHPHRGGGLLRLYIDRLGGGAEGVTVEDCEAVSRRVSATLDVADPIAGEYTLEVSSPGLDRPLRTLAHFERFAGSRVKVESLVPRAGRRRWTGKLVAVGATGIEARGRRPAGGDGTERDQDGAAGAGVRHATGVTRHGEDNPERDCRRGRERRQREGHRQRDHLRGPRGGARLGDPQASRRGHGCPRRDQPQERRVRRVPPLEGVRRRLARARVPGA